MAAFTQHAAALAELTAPVPLVKESKTVKNREASLHRPALIVRPKKLQHVQHCVRWALKHKAGLTVIGGGHSGHCLWPDIVSIDMSYFDQVHIFEADKIEGDAASNPGFVVVAEGGCKTGDIVQTTMKKGLTVPLGACPSVGAGMWLQGGIGHLSRLHGLACDSIIGAVMVSADSGDVLHVGHVPIQRRPPGSERPENEADLLWAIKGAGTNFGIIISVTFKAHPASTYLTQNWGFPLSNDDELRRKLFELDKLVAGELPRNCSLDVYLYNDADASQLRIGVTMVRCSMTGHTLETQSLTSVDDVLGPEDSMRVVDGVGLFETEMYMSQIHGGHSGGKTSSFKRCLFLSDIRAEFVVYYLIAAIWTRPSPLCYLHLLQGGGAIADVAAQATAFGCRDWGFACVITGVWPRDQDGTETARDAVRWVYKSAETLLPWSSGAYGADLGPDPRDTALAVKAFGPNRLRLSRLKRNLDPRHVLAHACPLSKVPKELKLVVLVTGESCAGKDFCAEVWSSMFTKEGFTVSTASISNAIKQEYAAASGADLASLLHNRAYKEHHRPAMTAFYLDQVRRRPQLPKEHFLDAVHGAGNANVLLITGMREKAPVATLSHLVPDSRLLEVRVEASEETRRSRGASQGDGNGNSGTSNTSVVTYRPDFFHNNDSWSSGNEAAWFFDHKKLLHYLHEDLQRLADMVRPVPDFPRRGMTFRHVLNIAQQRIGLTLCVRFFEMYYHGIGQNVAAVTACEAGGFVFASALAEKVCVPLVLIREAGKLPPPVISVVKSPSHISSSPSNTSTEERIEMERDVIQKGAPVVVVDDVLASGETLCAVLQLLDEAGISAENITIMVVAEFPAHRGRDLLRRRGFGRANIQSLLFFGGS
ncbi:hypothetical protein GGR54DRAFT_631802 [Hypoxylon sp. NC1633]|nr:hypothetical protein GGR54DRAFT_631802 [Hypoxylon sp. NC1633]